MHPVVKRLALFGLGALPVLGLLLLTLPSATRRISFPGSPLLVYDIVEPFVAVPYAAFGLLWVFGAIRGPGGAEPPEARRLLRSPRLSRSEGVNGVSRGLRPLLYASLFLMFMGHGLHNSANSIRGEVAYTGAALPGSLEALVDLWDERLGHIVLGSGLAGLVAYGSILQDRNRSEAPLGRLDRAALLAFAAPAGFLAARGAIEGSLAPVALVLLAGATGGGLVSMRLRNIRFHQVPFNGALLLVCLFGTASLLVLYAFTGWAQFTQWRG